MNLDIRDKENEAEWIYEEHKMTGSTPRCSKCRGFNVVMTRYCPNCGKKMVNAPQWQNDSSETKTNSDRV